MQMIVEEALRLLLATENDSPAPVEPLPSFGDPDGDFLVDLTDADAVSTAVDADRARRPFST